GGGPAYYFHIDAQSQLFISAGEFGPPPDRLRAIRQHIVDNADDLEQVLATPTLQATFGHLYRGDTLQRPPKGFSPDLPNMEYLKLKRFVLRRKYQLDAHNAGALRSLVAADFQAAHPWVSWLRQIKEGQVLN